MAERLQELASGALDGTLTEEEQAELDSSEEGRALQAALARDREALKALPRVKAPPELAGRVGLRARRERLNSWVRRGLGVAASLAVVWWGVSLFSLPKVPLTELDNLHGEYAGGPASLSLRLDAGARSGAYARVVVRYDYNGDGVWDNTDSTGAIALDDREGWETKVVRCEPYAHRDLTGGRVEVELVDSPGVRLDTASSHMWLPYTLRSRQTG